jgi:L-lactate dehydrogenase complex protein LldG
MSASTVTTEFEQRLARFTAGVAPLGATVERYAGSAEVAAAIAAVARELGLRSAIASSEFTGPAPEAAAALNLSGIELNVPAAVADARDGALGISLATLAVAETGSVMLAERTLEDRAVGLLTITHITLVRSDDLVPSLAEAAVALREVALRPGAGYGSLVTGPSRSADIEMSLTVGVQGPARVYVFFVDNLT